MAAYTEIDCKIYKHIHFCLINPYNYNGPCVVIHNLWKILISSRGDMGLSPIILIIMWPFICTYGHNKIRLQF